MVNFTGEGVLNSFQIRIGNLGSNLKCFRPLSNKQFEVEGDIDSHETSKASLFS